MTIINSYGQEVLTEGEANSCLITRRRNYKNTPEYKKHLEFLAEISKLNGR